MAAVGRPVPAGDAPRRGQDESLVVVRPPEDEVVVRRARADRLLVLREARDVAVEGVLVRVRTAALDRASGRLTLLRGGERVAESFGRRVGVRRPIIDRDRLRD